MELDKRIIEGKKPLSCVDIEIAKEFIGKKGYFANWISAFKDLETTEYQLVYATLKEVDGKREVAFTDDFDGEARYFLPDEWVEEEKKEPEYKPYTIKDFEKAFLNGEFEDFIIFREKDNPDNVYTMRYNGNFRKGGFEYICLGAKNFSFEHLFVNYEVANYDGDFVPFGVLEDD